MCQLSLCPLRYVSPACAGMIPVAVHEKVAEAREPRMRGDDPAAKAQAIVDNA